MKNNWITDIVLLLAASCKDILAAFQHSQPVIFYEYSTVLYI